MPTVKLLLAVALPRRPRGSRSRRSRRSRASPARAASTIRITSPVEDAYLSGAVRLVAVIEPAAMIKQVRQVVFFADGRRLCVVQRGRFSATGTRATASVEHTIRATAELAQGGRAAATVQTKGVKFAEAVDVDVVQLTAVVTDRNGRFVNGLKPDGLQGLRQRAAADDHQLQSENIELELVLRSTSARACATRCRA